MKGVGSLWLRHDRGSRQEQKLVGMLSQQSRPEVKVHRNCSVMTGRQRQELVRILNQQGLERASMRNEVEGHTFPEALVDGCSLFHLLCLSVVLLPPPFIILQNHLAQLRVASAVHPPPCGVLSSAGEEIRWPGFTACLYTFLSLPIHGQ